MRVNVALGLSCFKAVFLNFFLAPGAPLSSLYLCVPQPFVDAVTYKKKLISTLLIYILEYIYITFVYNTVLFLNILFRYNALFTHKSKNIMLIIGIIPSVLLQPDKQLQVF
jgi:hypothetical protein